jgi:hypothetical protein
MTAGGATGAKPDFICLFQANVRRISVFALAAFPRLVSIARNTIRTHV